MVLLPTNIPYLLYWSGLFRETEPIMCICLCVCVCVCVCERERERELVHMIVETGKYKICRPGQLETQGRVDVTTKDWKQNSFFLGGH